MRQVKPFCRYASFVYVVVCRGPNCRARGSLTLRTRLAKLLRQDPDVHLVGYACFGQCDAGPNVALYPPGVFYGGLTEPGDAERVIQHARGLASLTQPLEVPEPELAQHRRNIAELVRTLEADRARPRRRWWFF